MIALGIALGFGLAANLGLLGLSVWGLRQDQRRERRERAVARELNSRRWFFADQVRALGGASRVSSDERWAR